MVGFFQETKRLLGLIKDRCWFWFRGSVPLSVQDSRPLGAQAMCLRLYRTSPVEKSHKHLPR